MGHYFGNRADSTSILQSGFSVTSCIFKNWKESKSYLRRIKFDDRIACLNIINNTISVGVGCHHVREVLFHPLHGGRHALILEGAEQRLRFGSGRPEFDCAVTGGREELLS